MMHSGKSNNPDISSACHDTPDVVWLHGPFYSVTDAEAVAMSRYLVLNDGLFLGSSSACNLVACVKLARHMGWKEGQTIVTIL